ncbi:MAG: protein-methionine-sulfoxide reductase catalytic subunit MsrP [Proteobacteria bacterium]|nr:protein-methionine-sulfoxide reductase catalytic subunit MsrP [Pseudomonadota bacterium]TDJ34200.1 MAG: protein-methionine-sulfoxide reductase catalytic subunit MsrP [Gammaproteobacteria bacterium]
MLIRKPADIRPSEITSREIYLNRRKFIQSTALAGSSLIAGRAAGAIIPEERRARLTGIENSEFSTSEAQNSYADITTYNNYYEFGTNKGDPFRNSQEFEPRPWSITVSGHADRTGTFNLEDIVKPHVLEERIYRLRCVEAWSMVIPWVGIPLADIVKQFAPRSAAKYVVFRTLNDRARMPGQRSRVLQWPYIEALTIAEAVNPLAILAVGLYGEVLPNQNGAPIRLIVPWKYGFKSIKGIVSIDFSETRPRTSWEIAAPHEYGFYANVNPNVDHPRWSQARERRIGSAPQGALQSIFGAKKQPTLMFNGYGEQVAHLYDGLDLRRNF